MAIPPVTVILPRLTQAQIEAYITDIPAFRDFLGYSIGNANVRKASEYGIVPDEGTFEVDPDDSTLFIATFPTQTDHRAALQALMNQCAADGYYLLLDWRGADKALHVGGSLNVPSGLRWGGLRADLIYDSVGNVVDLDQTWIRSTDGNDPRNTVIQHGVLDNKVTDVYVENISVDYNVLRQTGQSGPNGLFTDNDCFCFGYCERVVGKNLFGYNSRRHVINPTSADDTRTGVSFTYPEVVQRTKWIWLDNIGGGRAGDDVVTTHGVGEDVRPYTSLAPYTVFLTNVRGGNLQGAWSSENSNCCEIDDDSVGVWLHNVQAFNVHAALEIKGHSDAKAARSIKVSGVVDGYDVGTLWSQRHISHDASSPSTTSPMAYNTDLSECTPKLRSLKDYGVAQTPVGFFIYSYSGIDMPQEMYLARGSNVFTQSLATATALTFFDGARDIRMRNTTVYTTDFSDFLYDFWIQSTCGAPRGTGNIDFGSIQSVNGSPTVFRNSGGLSGRIWGYLSGNLTAPGGLSLYDRSTTFPGNKMIMRGVEYRNIGYADDFSFTSTATRSPRLDRQMEVLFQRGMQIALPSTAVTTEQTLFTYTIYAGLLGKNSQLALDILASFTGTNTKTLRVKIDGITVGQYVVTTELSLQTLLMGANRNALNSQVWQPLGTNFGANAATVLTTAVNFATDSVLTITGQLSTTTENIRLERMKLQYDYDNSAP